MAEEKSIIDKIKRQIPEIDVDNSNQSLDKLISEAGLIGQDTERTLKFLGLTKSIKWMGTALELIWMLNGESSLKPKNPFILGLSNVKNATEIMGVCLEGEGWLSSSIKLSIDPSDPDHTPKFLRKLVNTKRDIVMVVPPNLYSHPKAKNTKSEMDWWLDHPESAENLYLVFGGVDLINREWLEKNAVRFKTSRGLIKHAAKDIKKIREVIQE